MHANSLLHHKYFELDSFNCPWSLQHRPQHPYLASHHQVLLLSLTCSYSYSLITAAFAHSAPGYQGISINHHSNVYPVLPTNNHSSASLPSHHQNWFQRTCCSLFPHCISHDGLHHILASARHVLLGALTRCQNDTSYSNLPGGSSNLNWRLSPQFHEVRYSLLVIN